VYSLIKTIRVTTPALVAWRPGWARDLTYTSVILTHLLRPSPSRVSHLLPVS